MEIQAAPGKPHPRPHDVAIAHRLSTCARPTGWSCSTAARSSRSATTTPDGKQGAYFRLYEAQTRKLDDGAIGKEQTHRAAAPMNANAWGHMSKASIRLERNTFGQLVLIDADGTAHRSRRCAPSPSPRAHRGIGLVGSEATKSPG